MLGGREKEGGFIIQRGHTRNFCIRTLNCVFVHGSCVIILSPCLNMMDPPGVLLLGSSLGSSYPSERTLSFATSFGPSCNMLPNLPSLLERLKAFSHHLSSLFQPRYTHSSTAVSLLYPSSSLQHEQLNPDPPSSLITPLEDLGPG